MGGPARQKVPSRAREPLENRLVISDKGHLLPDFYSGATGLPGRFSSEGFCSGAYTHNGVAWLPLDSGHRTAVRNRAREAATLLAIDVDNALALSKRVALQLAARAILDKSAPSQFDDTGACKPYLSR